MPSSRISQGKGVIGLLIGSHCPYSSNPVGEMSGDRAAFLRLFNRCSVEKASKAKFLQSNGSLLLKTERD